MTVGGWIGFIIAAILIIVTGFGIGITIDTKASIGISVAVSAVLVVILFSVMHWYYNSTESGQRAFKSQQSNFDGGLYRTVTVYGYSGEEIRSWTGKFDVTENDQETWFDIDGQRVIIQGGIIINEEVDPNG